jgi:hypothetical protein
MFGKMTIGMKFGNGTRAPYPLGMANIKGNVKIVRDIDEVLRDQESIELPIRALV